MVLGGVGFLKCLLKYCDFKLNFFEDVGIIKVIYLPFSHGGNAQEPLLLDTILGWKVQETLVSSTRLCSHTWKDLSYWLYCLNGYSNYYLIGHLGKAVVIAVGIVPAVMITVIVDLQDAPHTEEVVIILPGILLLMVEDQGGSGPGHFPAHLTVVQKGSMLGVLDDDAVC